MKKIISSSLVTCLLLALLFVSCKKKDDVFEQTQQNDLNTLYQGNAALKRSFGKALSKALASEPELRAFIRQEALKMFNEDYEMLYDLVKDE